MESSSALLSASSGLERLMAGSQNNVILRDSNVAQISAFLYYQANVIAKLETNKGFQRKFKEVVFGQLEKDFGQYIDAQARTKPKSLHHMYEWKKTGISEFRLFKLNFIDSEGLSFKLDYSFKPSQSYVPSKKSKKKYKFTNKASVMEADMPVIISPSSSKRLVFESNGITVFMPKGASVTVRSPGGRSVKNQFRMKYSHFFSQSLVKQSFMKSGFQKLFNDNMAKSLRIPSSIKKISFSFEPNRIRSEADSALTMAWGGGVL